MFPREQRLTKQRDIQKVYKLGKSAASSTLFICSLGNRLHRTRLAVVIGKKVAKKAVIRNRLKRLVRQSIQELLADQTYSAKVAHSDVILTIHRDPGLPYTLERLKPEVQQCFERLP
jgi:ribonuclease P protein component